MNPITETRYGMVRYVVLWGLFTAAYAVSFGVAAAMPAGIAALDGAVFGVVSGFEGLILWSVLKYGTESIGVQLLKTVYLTAVGILFIAVGVGAEVAAVYLRMETLPTAFMATLSARCLITAAVYVCFALWYSSAVRSNELETPERSRINETIVDKPVGEISEPIKRITVKGIGGRIEVIGVNDIVYLKAEGDYVAIVTTGGRWLKEGTMKWFEEALPPDRFVRVHRSYIVAVGHISRIETSGREHTLVLRTDAGKAAGYGESIRISDAGYRLLKRTLGL